MIDGESHTYYDFLQLGFACYLLINSSLIGIKAQQEKANLFFALTGILLSISLLSKVLPFNSLFFELISLCIWPSFFIYLLLHKSVSSLSFKWLLHLCIPIAYLFINILKSSIIIVGLFDIVYLLSIIGYGWASIFEASRLKKITVWKQDYLIILFIGLIVAIAFRFLLPIFFQSSEVYTLYFHLILSGYFILLSSFYIKSPKKNIEEQVVTIQREEAINYEENLKRKLKNAMLRDKIFLNPELTINDLASKLEINSMKLSNFINNKLGKNFNDFVNEHRVEEVKKLMSNPNLNPQATIMELAYEAGFNSKASFNRIFKQFTQVTPSQFKKTSKKFNEQLSK